MGKMHPRSYVDQSNPSLSEAEPRNSTEVENTMQMPEIYANKTLDGTSLVYSVPFRAEWKNGHLLRMIEGFLAQNTKPGEAFEVELIANIGFDIAKLIVNSQRQKIAQTLLKGDTLLNQADAAHSRAEREKQLEMGEEYDKYSSLPTDYADSAPEYLALLEESKRQYELAKQIESQGESIIIKEAETPEQQKTLDYLTETRAAAEFLIKLIRVQGISRQLKQKPKSNDLRAQLQDIINSESGVLERNILQKADQRAEQVAFLLVDTTEKKLTNTEYRCGATIAGLRTLGMDVAAVRFEGQDDLVISLFDADTLPENTGSVRDIQSLFSSDPRLTYVFAGMTHSLAGISREFVATAPSSDINHTSCYNTSSYHGSPQILFRLGAYKYIREISGYHDQGFHHDEDRDTALRLIYHFGKLQDGILFQRSLEGSFPPSVMTADRLDGFCDSLGRQERYLQGNEVHDFEKDVASVAAFRKTMLERIENQPPEKRLQMQTYYQQAKNTYQKKERIQIRMNRLVVRQFLKCLEEKLISGSTEGGLQIMESEIVRKTGGKALLHFVKANPQLIEEIINSSEDRQILRYYCEGTAELPNKPSEMTPFQAAVREYLGNLPKEDNPDPKVSILHAMIVELMALGATYRVFFETQDFLDRHKNLENWPEQPKEQQLSYRFGELEDRLRLIKGNLSGLQRSQQAEDKPWYKNISLDTFPIFRFFRELF